MRNALAGGRRGGVFTAFGVALGQPAWTVTAALGVASLLLASALAFPVVKTLGAAYLVQLGVQALRLADARRARPARSDPPAPPSRPGCGPAVHCGRAC